MTTEQHLPEKADSGKIAVKPQMVFQGDLILVNDQHIFDFTANESVVYPVKLREAQEYIYPLENEDFMAAKRIVPQLDSIIADCNQAMGTAVTSVSSAYRTIEYQLNLKKQITEQYGQEYADQYVAAAGCSEHHTGLGIDFGIIYEDGSEGTFSESENAKWMAENSWKYGFVRRYASDKVEITGISNEAWHFRYVGLPHAAYMYEKNLCLEEYLQFLREQTSPEDPLLISAAGAAYRVYYTEAEEIDRPSGEYTISGDNIKGIIVTIKE